MPAGLYGEAHSLPLQALPVSFWAPLTCPRTEAGTPADILYFCFALMS